LLIALEKHGSLPHICPQEKMKKIRMMSEKKIGGNCLLRLISPILSFVTMFSQHQDSALKTCDAAEKYMENKDAESDKEVEEGTPVPTFGEAVAGFEAVRRYMCSFKTDDASLVRLHQLERDLLFIRQTPPTKQKSLLDYFKK
jgi:hypothetical protein